MAELAEPERLRRLLDAVIIVGADLDLESMLRRITECAADLVDARYAALGVLNDDRTGLSKFITVGVSEKVHQQIGRRPEGHGLLGVLIVDAKPVRLPNLSEYPESYGFPPGHPPMRTFLGVPILLRDEVFGNLYLADKRSGENFTDLDEELVVGLATSAGVAIENARLHERTRDIALVEDRERIARDLHDTVIQRLIATGLSLQAVAPLVQDPTVAERLETAVDDLDTTVKQIRSTIFGLAASTPKGSTTRARVLRLCEESGRALGFRPHVFFDGPIDYEVVGEVADDLLATLRELLSNVARHAHASRVDVSIVVDADGVRLSVVDDGCGIPGDGVQPGYGLQNVAARAEHHGGTFQIAAMDGGGTSAEWAVPRPS